MIRVAVLLDNHYCLGYTASYDEGGVSRASYAPPVGGIDEELGGIDEE